MAVVGVDIGSRSVRAVELQGASGQRPTIARYAEVSLPAGSVRRGDVVDANTVATAFKRLWSTGGFTTKNVVLGMGGPSVIARELVVQRMPLARIRESLPFQVQELLPIPVGDAVLDFYPVAEAENSMVSGLLIAAVKQAVLTNVAAATAAGLRPLDVDLIPFALTRLLARDSGPRDVTAFVSIGADTTNITVARGGVPQLVRIVPIGGDDATHRLQSRLELSHDEAEGVKRRLGMARGDILPQDRSAVEVLYEFGNELIGSLNTTLQYYGSSATAERISQIVLSGGGARLTNLARYLGETSGVPVTLAPGVAGMTLSRRARTQQDQPESDLSVAAGLALGGAA